MMSEFTGDLTKALSKAQGEMKAATFNKVNPHFKNKYADLAAIIDAIRKPLADNGLAWTQSMERTELGLFLVTRLHLGEQWISSNHPLPNGGVTPQAFGSALTYARRYSLSAICGMAADEDEDAEEASKAKATTATAKYGNKPEEFIEHDLQYDTLGNPIDNIPVGQEDIQPMSKAMARPEYAKLLADIKSDADDLHALMLWGKLNANRVATLPADWQVHLRDEFRKKQIELGWKPGK
jgi:ERF superfamily